jgi:DNA-binding response OmpR family regulator
MAHILVVEDQKTVLMQVEALLKSRGHAVITASNSHDALDQLGRMHIDMIITDIMMPGGASGYELAKTIKKDPRFAGKPVMMMTGRRDQKDVAKGILSGADDYVVKPLDADLFLAKVEALLARPGQKDFAACNISVTAQWDMNVDIVGISEIGLEIRSPVQVQTGQNIKLNTDLFRRIGIASPTMHVTSCDPVSNIPPMYFVRLSFIGFTEKELQPVRIFIRDYNTKAS